jgi:DNA-binding SARP family transcriptional activator/LysM repeat protein
MSLRRVGRPTWPARLGAIAGLVAFCAAPIVVYVLAGRFPSFPRLTTWAAFRNSLSHADDAAFGDAVLRWAERVGVVLYLWLATELVITLAAQLADRLGRSSLRAVLESLQPRSVALALNTVVIAALSIAPRTGTGVAVASTPVSAPERPDPPGGGAPPPASLGTPTAETQTAQREHVVRPGESLWSIAAAECASPLYWRDIADLNGIEHPALIHPGTVLRIPAACEVPEHVAYVVAPGDTLSRIAQREYGAAGAWEAIWQANRGVVMSDGRTFSDPALILPGWTLRLPTRPGSLPTAAVATPAPAPAAGPPAHQEPAPAPAGPPTPAPDTVASPAAPARPARSPGASPADEPTHQVAPGHGVRIPAGPLIAPCVASGVLALALLARRRRRGARPLDSPEPRRADPPIIGGIRAAGTVPSIDPLAPHTEALSSVLSAAGRMPRVLGAWDDGEAVRFVLDADPATLPAGTTHEGLGIRVEFSDVDGLAVATTTGQRLPGLFRDPVAWTDDLLVPVGRHEPEGWLHVPLLSTPIAVTGPETSDLVSAMLLAAAMRAGAAELRVFLAREVTLGVSPPEGLDLPPFETVPTDGLPALLAQEAHARASVVAEKSCDNFAELSASWPGLRPAWVLVLDAPTAAACAGELATLADLGVGALVLGDLPGARTLRLSDGRLEVHAPGLGTFAALVPHLLPTAALVDELQAEALPLEPGPSDEADEIRAPAAGVDAPLRIHVLGGYRVQRHGADVALAETTSAQARELVAFLAVAGATSAVRLREILWPEEHDAGDVRRQSLHPLVSKARAWIGTPDAEDPVVHENGIYRLGSQVWVDVAAFRSAVASGDLASLQEAIALYGELLDGQDSGRRFGWVKAEGYRDAERSRYLGAAGRLAEALLDSGDPGKALSVLEPALLGEGAAWEPLVRIAVRCEAALGNPEGIRRRVAALEDAIGEDKVSPETRDLARSLLTPRRRPAADQPGLRVVPDGQVAADGWTRTAPRRT